ncbi:MAG: hypothetical protein SVR81_09620 [Chloroflexota bacterium]|nr:hypothetical protein [Chloroflexota bacterium]
MTTRKMTRPSPQNDAAVPSPGRESRITALVNKFIPMLREKDLDKATIRLLTEENPKRVLSLVL